MVNLKPSELLLLGCLFSCPLHQCSISQRFASQVQVMNVVDKTTDKFLDINFGLGPITSRPFQRSSVTMFSKMVKKLVLAVLPEKKSCTYMISLAVSTVWGFFLLVWLPARRNLYEAYEWLVAGKSPMWLLSCHNLMKIEASNKAETAWPANLSSFSNRHEQTFSTSHCLGRCINYVSFITTSLSAFPFLLSLLASTFVSFLLIKNMPSTRLPHHSHHQSCANCAFTFSQRHLRASASFLIFSTFSSLPQPVTQLSSCTYAHKATLQLLPLSIQIVKTSCPDDAMISSAPQQTNRSHTRSAEFLSSAGSICQRDSRSSPLIWLMRRGQDGVKIIAWTDATAAEWEFQRALKERCNEKA